MAAPLPNIAHKTRDVKAALNNNCWYVFWQPAPSEAEPQPRHQRLVHVRTHKGVFQVRLLQTWKWQPVAPADHLFQQ